MENLYESLVPDILAMAMGGEEEATEEVEDVRQFLATSRDEKDNISSEGWFELCRALLASNDFLMRL